MYACRDRGWKGMEQSMERTIRRILVLNGSPAGENSITLYTVLYLQKHFPEYDYEILHVGQRIRSMEKDFSGCAEALRRADLILFCYPVYTFLAPAQLHRFVELMKAQVPEIRGRFAAQITTSKHFYDVTAHRYIQDNCDDMGLLYLGGLSADMDDLLCDRGRREAREFFSMLLWRAAHGYSEPRRVLLPETACIADPESVPDLQQNATGQTDRSVVIVTDCEPDQEQTALMKAVHQFQACMPCTTRVVNLRTFPFAGGCLGCFHCAASGKCVYHDGFDTYLREQIQTADAIVYAFTIRDHSMGYRMKLYDDRQFCNGHRTVTMGKPVGYLVDGNLDAEPNLRMLLEARAEVGGNYLAGIASHAGHMEAEIRQLADMLGYAMEHRYVPPKNFYGVGGLRIFRDLIWQMQGLMREDHRFYKKHGFYDFPQKKRGRMLAMYLVGGMMRNRHLQKKIGGKMTEGMILPYRKALDK